MARPGPRAFRPLFWANARETGAVLVKIVGTLIATFVRGVDEASCFRTIRAGRARHRLDSTRKGKHMRISLGFRTAALASAAAFALLAAGAASAGGYGYHGGFHGGFHRFHGGGFNPVYRGGGYYPRHVTHYSNAGYYNAGSYGGYGSYNGGYYGGAGAYYGGTGYYNGGYRPSAYTAASGCGQSYAYATPGCGQNYEQSYVVPTTVYQPTVYTSYVPTTVYRPLNHIQYIPTTQYRTVRKRCHCDLDY